MNLASLCPASKSVDNGWSEAKIKMVCFIESRNRERGEGVMVTEETCDSYMLVFYKKTEIIRTI